MFREEDHKRVPKGSSEGGRFTKTSDGFGGTHEATKAEKKRLSELGIGKNSQFQKIELSKQEYAVLRKEVMRKNSAQKGKIKPINFGYTANYFYVYSTNGGDSFTPFVQLEVEEDRDTINYYENLLRGRK